MKKLITLALLVASFTATASLNCYSDAYGNTTCRDSNGGSSQWYTDNYGNSYGRDSNGNSTNCYSDAYGNTTCY